MEKPKEQYFVQLIGTRDGWPENMTPDEERIMNEHYYYLKDLVAQKKAIAAGPVFDPVFGLIILQTESRDEALHIMDNEPSVVQGVHTYKISPMRVSLLADFLSPERYPKEISDRILKKETMVSATIDKVWEAWTTSEGAAAFFSPYNRIDFRLGGAYEIYFNHEAAYGLRGSEGCRILSFLPKQMLSFEWNAPPDFGPLRRQHTQVILQFDPVGTDSVKVTLTQFGWGIGPEWDRLYDYFNRAWGYVLENLRKCFTEDSAGESDIHR
ncbi:MAG: SRPBCC domain-containing protein [Candidatus Zixiibacteriota bacterium]